MRQQPSEYSSIHLVPHNSNTTPRIPTNISIAVPHYFNTGTSRRETVPLRSIDQFELHLLELKIRLLTVNKEGDPTNESAKTVRDQVEMAQTVMDKMRSAETLKQTYQELYGVRTLYDDTTLGSF